MNHALAIVDARCSTSIIERLSNYANEIFLFRTTGITYESISCHPDIFIFHSHEHLIVSPNAPRSLLDTLKKLEIDFQIGNSFVGEKLQDSCFYNCVSTEHRLFHKPGYTDPCILRLSEGKTKVELPQPYTRCSMIALSDNRIITSDAGIHKSVGKRGIESFLFDPHEITIPVHPYGFLGGTCGISENRLFFLGNPMKHKDGPSLCHFIENSGFEVIPLSDEKLYDGGGLFFL